MNFKLFSPKNFYIIYLMCFSLLFVGIYQNENGTKLAINGALNIRYDGSEWSSHTVSIAKLWTIQLLLDYGYEGPIGFVGVLVRAWNL